jgi:hypothetical protein
MKRNTFNKHYPFNEGDDYWTVEDGEVVWSCWDQGSEELFDENPNKKYFTTEEKAEEYLEQSKKRIIAWNIEVKWNDNLIEKLADVPHYLQRDIDLWLNEVETQVE